MANVICGMASGTFINQGVEIDIAPPQLMYNQKDVAQKEIICSSLMFANGDVLFVDLLAL